MTATTGQGAPPAAGSATRIRASAEPFGYVLSDIPTSYFAMERLPEPARFVTLPWSDRQGNRPDLTGAGRTTAVNGQFRGGRRCVGTWRTGRCCVVWLSTWRQCPGPL